MLLLRSVFALLAAGMAEGGARRGACVSRAHMYMLQDVDSASGGTYATSGLVASEKYGGAPKDSFFHYSAAMHWLGDYAWAGDGALLNGTVATLCLRHAATGALAAVLWSPTTAGTVVAGVALDATAAACALGRAGDSLSVVLPQAPLREGKVTPAVVAADGTVTLSVTEMPTFVLKG